MDKNLKNDLTAALEQVSDTYDDFVSGISQDCKTDSDRQAVIDYIENNPTVSTSEVILFIEDVLNL